MLGGSVSLSLVKLPTILNYNQIKSTLTDIFENCNKKQENHNETKSIKNKIIKFKIAFMVIM